LRGRRVHCRIASTSESLHPATTRNIQPRYTLRLAFHFMDRLSLAHIIDSTCFSKKQVTEPALQSIAIQILRGLWCAACFMSH
jgi:hypothetical protein